MHYQENTVFDLNLIFYLHHVTYTATKFEVAASNGLEGDAFTREYII